MQAAAHWAEEQPGAMFPGGYLKRAAAAAKKHQKVVREYPATRPPRLAQQVLSLEKAVVQAAPLWQQPGQGQVADPLEGQQQAKELLGPVGWKVPPEPRVALVQERERPVPPPQPPRVGWEREKPAQAGAWQKKPESLRLPELPRHPARRVFAEWASNARP